MTTNSTKPPSLNVELYFIEELLFRVFVEHNEDKESFGAVDVDVDVERHEDNPRDYRLTMRIKLADDGYSAEENPPYGLALRIVGLFAFTEGTDDADMQRMIRLNGSSILYGIARGIVGQATGASLYGQFVLPTVNFVELWNAKIAKEVATANARQGSLPAAHTEQTVDEV